MAAKRIEEHSHKGSYQFLYNGGNSRETALLEVHCDLAGALDKE